MASAYTTAYNQLGAAYDPQTKLINQQVAQIDPQVQAQTAALDQAKVNAFRDITDQSNSRGVLFSGVPIDQQAQYVGTKYLPAIADLKSTALSNKNTLLGQLNTLNAKRVTQAQGAVSANAAAKADAAYKNAQLQLGYAKLQASQSRGAGGLSVSAQRYADSQATAQAQHNTANKIIANLSKSTGGDGYVSPQSYSTAQRDWVQAGYSLNDFDNYFKYFKNPSNPYYGK